MQQNSNVIDVIITKFSDADLCEFDSLLEDTDNSFYKVKIRATKNALIQYKMYREHCFVAHCNKQLIGYIYGGILCDTLYPQHLYVHPSFRQKGIGRALLHKLEVDSKCSVSMIYFDTDATEFYAKQNYDIGRLVVACKALDGE